MNFDDYSYDELDEHIMSKLVLEADELSSVLKGHIFIEKILETLIVKNLHNPKSFFKGRRSYELKLDLAFAMGLIDKKHLSAFKALGRIRNNYVHGHDYQLKYEELNALKFDWQGIQEEAYQGACTVSEAEAAKIAIIFLCWKAIHLIKDPSTE